MNKHTPGPWRSRKVGGPAFKNQVLWAIDFNEDQEQVVDFVYEESDALLIAAAPDLLAALEDIIASECRQPDIGCAWTKARAAIARAKGEEV